MSFETITIYRDYQIINGYVQVPPNLVKDRTNTTVDEALSEITDSVEYFVTSVGSGPETGSGFGQSRTIRFPWAQSWIQ
jgi:hypothetical protein